MPPPFYTIIYVRGFAATMSDIDQTSADPYMGFNIGSSLLRQDHQKQPVRFFFESPLLRLMKDHGYSDAFNNGGYLDDDKDFVPGSAPARSIWVFRYYERASELLGDGERVSMEQFALDLRRFILKVRDATCGEDTSQRAAFNVHLVAHSMGGLLCRCYVQNICRHGAQEQLDDTGLELTRDQASPSYVNKLFTYGTPHNGIDLLGMNVPDLGPLDRFQVSNFDHDRMRDYLKISDASKGVNELDGALASENCFCFIGSNYRDYGASFGLSRRVTGPASDRLVMIANAYTKDSPRAVANRSHSGEFGLVNSESGYQNLRRFLFGDLRIKAVMYVDRADLPPGVQERFYDGAEVRGSYYFDASIGVRARPNYLMNERRHDHASALFRTFDSLVREENPVYLFTGYLLKDARMASVQALMFKIKVGVRVPLFEIDKKFWFDEHFEGFMYEEQITVAVRPGSIRYGFSQKNGIGNSTHQAAVEASNGQRIIRIPVGTAPNARPGFAGQLELTVEDWV